MAIISNFPGGGGGGLPENRPIVFSFCNEATGAPLCFYAVTANGADWYPMESQSTVCFSAGPETWLSLAHDGDWSDFSNLVAIPIYTDTKFATPYRNGENDPDIVLTVLDWYSDSSALSINLSSINGLDWSKCIGIFFTITAF